ncbi:MAG TPA: FAD-dependent oxidoreductase [Nitrososphaeraceae archaeon]|nr:FAD-dependent oxidoreductase [Nitrososphaeraceae archaeon]
MQESYDVSIVGGGILGCAIAYFLSITTDSTIIVMEQEKNVAMHTSSRNTGKVHAPFYYNPEKKSSTATYALKGFDMLKRYCSFHDLPFKEDGVVEIASNEREIDILLKHVQWAHKNGLRGEDVKFLSKHEMLQIEPNVKCEAGIVCIRDASTDYGLINQKLMEDAIKLGCKTSFENKFRSIRYNTNTNENRKMTIKGTVKDITTDYVINATGGNSLDIAHNLNLAKEFTDLHFRGEYWIAPKKYNALTKRSIYSVPRNTEYPFLDPHWIIRSDGRCEVGPNAVPVFSPYAYTSYDNLKNVVPKILASCKVGVLKLFLNKQFLQLVSNEFSSSFSKTNMVNRVRRFLPSLNPRDFKQRGMAGIRTILIDKNGEFASESLVVEDNSSLHILNYNSPGATGALPVAANIARTLVQKNIVNSSPKQINFPFSDEIA